MISDFEIHAGWLLPPERIGTCSVNRALGKEVISFSYDKSWLGKYPDIVLDPDVIMMEGVQYPPADKKCFGFLSDIAPDRWGRRLMDRREAADAKAEARPIRTLMESDYILGVHDMGRMGGLRLYDRNMDSYISEREDIATPPMEKLRELCDAAYAFESGGLDEYRWLEKLLNPGSSLGGARPKANVIDENNNIWIAKFPSQNDEFDIGAWEMVAHNLAVKCGIRVPDAYTLRLNENGTTFLSKRFDRDHDRRKHFVSAMTMTGHTDGDDGDYLELCDIIEQVGDRPAELLAELWTRIVFYICISNTDDHLRNHGFLLENSGWTLSPAYDINPDIKKGELSLTLGGLLCGSVKTAVKMSEYFRIDQTAAEKRAEMVMTTVRDNWKHEAKLLHISSHECSLMSEAFSRTYS